MILVIIGLILYLIGAIGLLIEEFRENILWGLAGLFLQITHLIFAILHFDKCKSCLGLSLFGFILMVIGCLIERGTQVG